MEVFIDHPNTETWQGHLSRNIVSAYLAPLSNRESTGVSDSAHYQQISPTCSRPTRLRPDHSTTSALLQMTTDIAMGFNQKKPPDRTICVAVYLSVAFDTVCHNNLLSKINRSQLPPATARWLSCYLRWNRPEEDFSSGKLESTHLSRTVVKSTEVFYGVESVVRGNADSLLN